MRLPWTIAWRPNGEAIQDKGVCPDICYAEVGDVWSAVVPKVLACGPEPFALRGDRTFLPILGEIEEELAKDASFLAYIGRLGDRRKIGYVRMPHYDYNEDAVNAFGNLIPRFQNETSALVLDQVNNRGGSMFQMYAILSFLTDRPLTHLPQHQLCLPCMCAQPE